MISNKKFVIPVVIGNASKALSDVGDKEHNPFGFGAVSYLKYRN